MQRQIGFGDLLERGAKRGDQRVRQPIDEPDRVGDEQLAPIRQTDPPDERIERHEQRVGCHGSLIRQPVEQRRLAGVGVADERHRRHRLLVAPLAQLRSDAGGPDRSHAESTECARECAGDRFRAWFHQGRGCRCRRQAATTPSTSRPVAAAGISAARARPATCLRASARAARRCRESAVCDR